MAKSSSIGTTPLGLALVLALVATISLMGLPATEAACPAADLNPCLDAAEKDVAPSAACCSSLSTYTSTNDVACLCEAAMGSAFFTPNAVNFAILIPQKCDLNFPAGTECGGVVIPGGK